MMPTLLLFLALVFANIWSFRMKDRFVFITTWGLSLGALLVIFTPEPWSKIGMYLYLAATAAVFGYGVVAKQKSIPQRSTISLMAAATFTYWLWVSMHWHGNTLLIPMFILLVGFAGIIRQVRLKKELGLLLIFAVDAVAILLEHWLKIYA